MLRPLLLASPVAIALSLAIALPVSADPDARFADWCANRDNLTADQQHTVDVLLQAAETEDCAAADAALSRRDSLDLLQQGLRDLTPLASLPQLTSLMLAGNQIETVAPLTALENLTFLILTDNQIRDPSPLAQLSQLNVLILARNQITDISSLAPLAQLQSLNLLHNPIAVKECPVRPATACFFDQSETDLLAAAEAQFQAGEFQAALASFETALATYEEQGDRLRAGDALNRVAATRVQLSQYAQAMALYEPALALRRDLGDLPGIGVTLAGLAAVYERLGRYNQAEAVLAAAFDNLAAQSAANEIPLEGGVYEFPKDEGNLWVNRARVQVKRADFATAAQSAERALERFELLPEGYAGKALGQRAAWEILGQAQFGRGQRERAIARYEQALTIAKANGDRAGQGLVFARLGRLYEDSQLELQALDAYQQALALHRAVGDRASEGATLSRIGATHWAQNKPEAALEPLQAAIAIWENLRPGLSDADKVALFETQLQTYENLQAALIALERPEAALETAERGRAAPSLSCSRHG